MRSILATHDLDTLFRRKDVQGWRREGRDREGEGKDPLNHTKAFYVLYNLNLLCTFSNHCSPTVCDVGLYFYYLTNTPEVSKLMLSISPWHPNKIFRGDFNAAGKMPFHLLLNDTNILFKSYTRHI